MIYFTYYELLYDFSFSNRKREVCTVAPECFNLRSSDLKHEVMVIINTEESLNFAGIDDLMV